MKSRRPSLTGVDATLCAELLDSLSPTGNSACANIASSVCAGALPKRTLALGGPVVASMDLAADEILVVVLAGVGVGDGDQGGEGGNADFGNKADHGYGARGYSEGKGFYFLFCCQKEKQKNKKDKPEGSPPPLEVLSAHCSAVDTTTSLMKLMELVDAPIHVGRGPTRSVDETIPSYA